MFGCDSHGGNQGNGLLSPGAPVGRSMPVGWGEWRIADDVTRLCRGAPSKGENPPVTDPSRSSVHNDRLSALLRAQCLKSNLVEGDQVTASNGNMYDPFF